MALQTDKYIIPLKWDGIRIYYSTGADFNPQFALAVSRALESKEVAPSCWRPSWGPLPLGSKHRQGLARSCALENGVSQVGYRYLLY